MFWFYIGLALRVGFPRIPNEFSDAYQQSKETTQNSANDGIKKVLDGSQEDESHTQISTSLQDPQVMHNISEKEKKQGTSHAIQNENDQTVESKSILENSRVTTQENQKIENDIAFSSTTLARTDNVEEQSTQKRSSEDFEDNEQTEAHDAKKLRVQ